MNAIFRWILRMLMALAMLATAAACTLWLAPRLVGVSGAVAAEQANRLAIRGVTVLNPGEPAVAHRTVVFARGKIESIVDDTAAVPSDALVIDGQGGWLMPGLIDAHVHVIDGADLSLLLGHGITTARNMLGRPVHLAMRDAVAQGKIAGPRLITAGPVLDTPSQPGSFHLDLHTPDEVRAAVWATKRAGYDLVKLYDGLSPALYTAAIEEARQQHLPVAGHPPRQVPIEQLAADLESMEHMEELWNYGLKQGDDAAVDAMAATLAHQNVPLVATLAIVQRLADVCGKGEQAIQALDRPQLNPLFAFFGRRSLNGWVEGSEGCDRWSNSADRMGHIVARMVQQGVPIALGSDSGPHLSVHGELALDEMERLHRAGLSNEDVLVAATRNAALAVGRADQLGRIAPGFAADALLLSADPRQQLSLVRQPIGVLSQGRWYDAAALRGLLDFGTRHAGLWVTLGRLLQD